MTTEHRTVTCRFCGEAMPDDAGAYYHRKQCEQYYVAGLLADAQERGESPETIKALERRLEDARYVGD
jgi:hypothetical protein